MTDYSVELAGLAAGTVTDQYGNALAGRAMFVYSRGTTTQVQVYSDAAMTIDLSQPLITVEGDLPGYVASGQSLDITDQLTGQTMQAEAINAASIGAGDLLAANNLSDVVSASSARTNLGLGSAATQASSAFDAAGTATTAVATETTRAEAAETLLAPLASPALTGSPTAPTQTAADNSTKLSTTAYADRSATNAASAISVPSASSTTPVIDGTGAAGSSTSFARGDHVHPTDSSRAPLASPTLTGTVTIPTPTTGDNTTKAASTAFVTTAVATETSRATTAEALKAPLASPALTGTPTVPTATAGTNTTQAASTAFVTTAVAGAGGGAVSSVFTRTGAVTASSGDYTVSQVTGAAPLASPGLTGTPTAPTATALTSTTQLATTAYADSAVAVEATARSTADALKAPLASPALTGTPTVPTAAVDTNTTQAASTAWVLAQVSATVPVIDGTASVGSGTRFALSNHVHPTDTSRAALASPTFTGTPAAPTATAGTNTTQVATTAFVTTAVAAGGGGSGTGLFNNVINVKDATYGATGNGSTNDTTAIQSAINAAVTAGAPLYFPPGNYLITGATLGLTGSSASLRIIGAGQGVSTITVGPTGSTNAELYGINLTSSQTLWVQDMSFVGPATMGTGGNSTCLYHTGTAGGITVNTCSFSQFMMALQLNGTTVSTYMTVFDSTFYGFSSGTLTAQHIGAFEATPAVWTPVKRIFLSGCRFTGFGDPTGGSLRHAVYSYTSWSLNVDNCIFDTPAATTTGYCIQHFDSASVSGTSIAKESVIKGCVFASNLSTCNSVYTDYNFKTRVSDCDFQNASGPSQLICAFDAQIDDCRFLTPTTNPCIQMASGSPASTVKINGCSFSGAPSSGSNGCIYMSGNNYVYMITDCLFEGATSSNSAYIQTYSGSTMAASKILIDGCYFTGTPSRAVYGQANNSITVRNSTFNVGNYAIGNSSTALTLLNVVDNDFTGTTSVFSLAVTPTTLYIQRNIGYKTENGAAYSSTPGAVTTLNIAHGLGDSSHAITPTRFAVTPGNTAAQTAVMSATVKYPVITATSTNIVLTFAAALTTSTTYVWNWEAVA